MEQKIKVIIVDDHQIFRKGLSLLLGEIKFVELIGSVDDGESFLELIEEKKPDIVLMDVKMPGIGGVVATQKALSKYPEIKIVALSMFDESDYVKSILDAGACGYLLKNIKKDELENALQMIAQGKFYYSNELSSLIINKMLKGGGTSNKQLKEKANLTKREIDVLKLICQGLTNQQIAEKLFISQRTVDGHRANLLSKTNASNTVGLVKYAVKNKIVKF